MGEEGRGGTDKDRGGRLIPRSEFRGGDGEGGVETGNGEGPGSEAPTYTDSLPLKGSGTGRQKCRGPDVYDPLPVH